MNKQLRILIAEAIGTLILVVGGPGTAILATGGFGGKDVVGVQILGVSVGVLGVAFAFGLSLLCAAYAIGSISGCHINPAVTLGLAAIKKCEWALTPFYIVGQVVGGVLGGLVIWLIVKSNPAFDMATSGFASNGYGEHSPGGFGIGAAIATEIIFTAIFIFIIASTSRKSMPTGFTGVTVGLALTLIHLITIPIDNTSVNPARSIATAVFKGDWALSQLWVFIVFPIIGGIIGAGLWKVLVDKQDA
ncbi:MAG: aquaporin Z [Acidimicrobiia bacterium]